MVFFSKDIFLSQAMGVDAFNVQVPECDGEFPALVAEMDSMREETIFATVKIDVSDVSRLSQFIKIGFVPVDTLVVFQGELSTIPESTSGIHVRRSRPEDATAVRELAGNNIRFSRFHLDPRISNRVADKLNAEWAENYFKGLRGDAMLIAETNGQIVAFCLLIITDGTLLIDLIAVDACFQSNGIGRELIHTIRKEFNKLSHILSGTQIANVKAIRLYETMGLHFERAQYILHLHTP